MSEARYFSKSCLFILLFVFNLEADTPLYEKYKTSAINAISLVERQGLKYQVNTTKPFSGRFIGFEGESVLCYSKAGSYRNGLLHGAYEEYQKCGYYSFKTEYKNGVEHGRYIEYCDTFVVCMEGDVVNGLAEGEWVGYDHEPGRIGRVVWIEDVKNDITMSLVEFLYYDNGQISEKNSYNGSKELHGVSEAYYNNGQLESKILFENGELARVIEKYDFYGNSLTR